MDKKIDLNAGHGIAVREYNSDVGPADYFLFFSNKSLCGNCDVYKQII